MLPVIVIMVMTVTSSLSNGMSLWGRWLSYHRLLRLLDYFIKFAAIKPDTSALGAVIDLDPLSFRHHQLNTA